MVDWAAVSGKPEVALILLELADQQDIGDTLAVEARAAFFWSVTQGYLELLRELLRRGADVGQPSPLRSSDGGISDNGESALMAAVAGSRKEEMLELLRHGAWESEPEERKAKLLGMASRRKFVAEAFQEACIGDFTKF